MMPTYSMNEIRVFGEYGEIFDDDGNVTLAHNGDYKPIPLEEVKS